MSGGRRLTAIGGVAVVLVLIVVLVGLVRSNDEGLIVSDAVGDWREPGRDWGGRCDPGTDVESIHISRDGDSLVVDVELDSPPAISSEVVWTVQFNAASTPGRVCGASNVVGDDEPGSSVAAYGFDPAFGLSELTRRELPAGVCRATLDGSTVSFVVEMGEQDPAAPIRVVGSVRLEFLHDDTRPGSEDDFGFDATLSTL